MLGINVAVRLLLSVATILEDAQLIASNSFTRAKGRVSSEDSYISNQAEMQISNSRGSWRAPIHKMRLQRKGNPYRRVLAVDRSLIATLLPFLPPNGLLRQYTLK